MSTTREIQIDLGGRTRTMRMNLNTMAAFEEATNSNLLRRVQTLMTAMDIRTLRTLLWALLSDDVDEAGKPETIQAVGSWIDWTNLAYVTSKIGELISGKAADPRALAPFVPTPEGVVDLMLGLAGVKDQVVVDLGCGDGRALRRAIELGANQAIGFEINPERAKDHEDLPPGCSVIYEDAMGAADQLRKADVVFLYLLSESNLKLRPLLETTLRAGARVVSHDFAMDGWLPARVEVLETEGREHTVYLWTIGNATPVKDTGPSAAD